MSTLRTNAISNAAGTSSVPTDTVINGTCKAWVNFNGTFASSPFTTANGGIRAAFNVASVTDNGLGDYTVNFAAALADANYAAVLSGGQSANTNDRGGVGGFPGTTLGTPVYSASAVRICMNGLGNSATGANDIGIVTVAVFR